MPSLACADFAAAPRAICAGQHLHQTQAQRARLPPVDARRQARRRCRAPAGTRGPSEPVRRPTVDLASAPVAEGVLEALVTSSLRISPHGTAAFDRAAPPAQSSVSRTSERPRPWAAPEVVVSRLLRVFGEIHAAPGSRTGRASRAPAPSCAPGRALLEDRRAGGSPTASAWRLTRLEITCMLFFTR